MLPETIGAWFLSFLLPWILPVSAQSQVAEKVAERNTTATPALPVGGDVTAPKAIYAPAPEFSETARKAGYQGTCVLSLIVGTNGRPSDIRVERRLGMQLDEEAIRALKKWKFEPAQENGNPIAVSIEVEFSFQLGRNGGGKEIFSAEQYQQMREARSRIQSQIYRNSGGEEPFACPTSSSDRPEVTVADVSFEGDLRIPSVDRERMAVSIKQRSYSGSKDDIASEVAERVQRAWQNSGYFAAQASAETRSLTSSPTNERIAVTVHIEEGQQYRLEEIRFRNNLVLTNIKALRDLFPIKDGDVLTRDAIEQGTRDLHRAYGEYGYIDLSSALTTWIHEERATVSFDLDLDEGKQFYITRVDLVGFDEVAFENLKK